MPITVTCLGCDAQLTFPDEQAGILAVCPSCAAEVSVPRPNIAAMTTAPVNPESEAPAAEAIMVEPAEEPVPMAELVEEPSNEELLELGPRWRQVRSAFVWVEFGVSALMVGIGFRFVFVLLGVLLGNVFVLISLLPSLIAGIGTIALYCGQLFCLRVPAGTRARPAAAISLAARLVTFALNVFSAFYWWDAEAIQGRGKDTALITALALLLGSWTISLVAELSFLVFLKRIGRFLADRAMVRHAWWAVWITLGYIVVSLILSVAGIALTYQNVLEKIAAHKARFPMADPQPLSWLLSRITDMLFASKGFIPDNALGYLIISAVSTAFWIVLGTQYRAALNSANATIKAGLARGADS